jgi:uncharacterized protein (UPF0335 family)
MLMDVEEKQPAGRARIATNADDMRPMGKQPKRGEKRAPGASKPAEQADDVIRPAATNQQLIAFLERIERVEEERAALGGDLKEIYAELKGCGFDPKIVRKLISLRKMDEQERLQAEALLVTYMRAAGMAVQMEMEF